MRSWRGDQFAVSFAYDPPDGGVEVVESVVFTYRQHGGRGDIVGGDDHNEWHTDGVGI